MIKKAISLSQASKLSGYHSDYLSSLIRKGELKGEKIGGSWFTTEEDLKEYIFKQEIRHKKFAVSGFLSQKRTKKIFFISGVIFISLLFVCIYFFGKNNTVVESKTTLSPDVEIIQ